MTARWQHGLSLAELSEESIEMTLRSLFLTNLALLTHLFILLELAYLLRYAFDELAVLVARLL